MIRGVILKPLKVIPDERGFLMEGMRADDGIFQKFGQVYLSVVYPGVVKGWHKHVEQTDHFMVVKGMAKIVIHDLRADSPSHGETNEFFLGEQNPALLVIPKRTWHGMKGIGTEPAYIVNMPDQPYNYTEPDEDRIDPSAFGYDWARKDG